MSINVKGVFLGLKYVLKVMEGQGSGSIINTASTAGVRSEHSMAVYSASKHTVVGLTKSASLEYVKKVFGSMVSVGSRNGINKQCNCDV